MDPLQIDQIQMNQLAKYQNMKKIGTIGNMNRRKLEGYLEFYQRYGENEEELEPQEIRKLLHWYPDISGSLLPTNILS